jgi:hypothetical protein
MLLLSCWQLACRNRFSDERRPATPTANREGSFRRLVGTHPVFQVFEVLPGLGGRIALISVGWPPRFFDTQQLYWGWSTFTAGGELTKVDAFWGVPCCELVTYGYDAAGRLNQITKGALTATITYDAIGRRSAITQLYWGWEHFCRANCHRHYQAHLSEVKAMPFRRSREPVLRTPQLYWAAATTPRARIPASRACGARQTPLREPHPPHAARLEHFCGPTGVYKS